MPRNEKAPAFQVYAADELADAQTMTDDQFGKWSKLRAMAWRDIGIPADHAQLAAILRVKPKDFPTLWAVIGGQWVERGGRYVLPWMEAQREKQRALRERNAQNGQHGGRPRNPEPDPDGTDPKPSGFPEVDPDESSSSFCLLGSSKQAADARADARTDARDGPGTTGDRPAVGDVATALVCAANNAVTEAWGGESPSPFVPTHGAARDLAQLVADDAIPLDLAARAVFTACKAFCAKARQRGEAPFSRPNAMVYFAKPVRDAWAKRRATTTARDAPTPAPLDAPSTGVVPFVARQTRTDRVVARSIQGTLSAIAGLKGRTA